MGSVNQAKKYRNIFKTRCQYRQKTNYFLKTYEKNGAKIIRNKKVNSI